MSRDIALALIDRDPQQPRQHFDASALDELAQSMEANGLAVPILLRPVGERFVIVHGERRYRAAQRLGWPAILAEVRELDAEAARWLALIENVQRQDLSPIEEARAYRAWLDTGVTQEALGQRIGKSQSHIATKLRFLKLEPDAQAGLDQRLISEGHAKQLLRLPTPEHQAQLYARVLAEQLTVQALREAVDATLALAEHEAFIEDKLIYYASTLGDLLHKARHSLEPQAFMAFLEQNRITPEQARLCWAMVDVRDGRRAEPPPGAFGAILEMLEVAKSEAQP